MSKHTVDVIIVGQGIAGTMLAHFLKEKGAKVLVIDNRHHGASTPVAAGIINPVTGKRIVKSWNVDQLLPFAKATYKTLEARYDLSLLRDMDILRALQNQQDENEWLYRSAMPGMESYVSTAVREIPEWLKQKHGWVRITGSAKVDMAALIRTFRNELLKEHALIEAKFDSNLLTLNQYRPVYAGQVYADQIVFCEGHAGAENRFFSSLPFQPSKGEALIIGLDVHLPEYMVKDKITLVPLGDGTCWAGASNSWDIADDAPTPEAGEELESGLQDLLDCPFRILSHRSAIRPTVKDRMPMLGVHPEHRNIYIFNGLGTKGALLAPFMANMMAEFMLHKKPLLNAIDINRFSKGSLL